MFHQTSLLINLASRFINVYQSAAHGCGRNCKLGCDIRVYIRLFSKVSGHGEILYSSAYSKSNFRADFEKISRGGRAVADSRMMVERAGDGALRSA